MARSGRQTPTVVDLQESEKNPVNRSRLFRHENRYAVGAHQIFLLRQQRELQALFGNILRRKKGSIGETKPFALADLWQLELEVAGICVGNEMHVIARTIVAQLC